MNQPENIDGKSLEVSGKIFTLSNAISFSRVFVAFPVVWLHYNNDLQADLLIISLIIYGVISDYLDGLVARRTNTISEMGKMIDPVADKLCALTLFVYTVWLGWVPEWFLIFAIIRDSLIMAGSYYIKKRYDKVAMSITSGKISVNLLALYWLAVFFFQDAVNVHMFLLACTTTMMLISLFDYFNRYRKIMAGAEFN